jgi:GMP reductase
MSQKIINDIKLGFKDVLIKPKRSSLASRSQVELKRTFHFKNSPKTWTGVPIVSANMDTTGTFEIAKVLAQHDMLTAVHKHYTEEEWDDFLNSLQDEEREKMYKHIMVSSGTSEKDFEKLKNIMAKHPIDFICLDIANGYSDHFSKFVQKVRNEFSDDSPTTS